MAKSKIATAFIITLSVLVGSASYLLRARHSVAGEVSVRFGELPLNFESYSGREEWFDDATYSVLNADTSTLRSYVDVRGQSLFFFAAYFGEQNYGQQIHSPRNCLPGGGWNILSSDRISLDIPGRGHVISNRLLIETGNRRQLMYYFFLTRIGSVASEYRLKFHLAKAALTFKRRDATFIRVTVPVKPGNEENADRRIQDFLRAGMPLLDRGLPF